MTAATPTPTRDRLSGADGLRALAALGVIASHLFQRLNLDAQPGWLQEIQVVMMKGAFGVSVFFVLSGMLLAYPFWLAYLEGRPFPRIGHYARRRFARIAPGFYASLLVSFVVGLALFPDAPDTVRRLIAGLTFTSGFDYVTFFPVESNGPLWSIGFEVVSYVLMPLAMAALFLVTRRQQGRRSRAIGLGWWALVLALVIAVNQWIITAFVTDDLGKGWENGLVGGAKLWMPDYNPIGFFGHFAIGVLAAAAIALWRLRAAHTVADTAADTTAVAARGYRRWWWDAVALVGLGAMAWLVWSHRWPPEPDHTSNFQHAPYLFPMFAAAVAVALVGLAGSRVLARAVDNPFARFTAKVSFGLYIWHYLVLHLVSYLTDGEFEYYGILNPVKHLWLSVAVLLMSYAVAMLSWHLIERPVLESRWATAPARPRGARRPWLRWGGRSTPPAGDDAARERESVGASA